MSIRIGSQALFTFFFLMLFVLAIFLGWDWPMIAKLLPVYVVAVPGLILTALQLYQDLTGVNEKQPAENSNIEMDETFVTGLERRTEILRTVIFFAWFLGAALAIWLLGIVIALPLMMFLYTLIEGREKWFVSILMSAAVYLVIWGLFEYLLETRWPSGALFS